MKMYGKRNPSNESKTINISKEPQNDIKLNERLQTRGQNKNSTSRPRETKTNENSQPELKTELKAPRAKIGRKFPVILPRLPKKQGSLPSQDVVTPQKDQKLSFQQRHYDHITQPSEINQQLLKPVKKLGNYELNQDATVIDKIRTISHSNIQTAKNNSVSNDNFKKVDIVFGVTQDSRKPADRSLHRLNKPVTLRHAQNTEVKRPPADRSIDKSLRVTL